MLTERNEAQANLEAARDFYLAGDVDRAAAQLRAAAQIDRDHASAALEPARAALLGSARELDGLSVRVAERGLSTVTPMDSAFARLHLAEVQLHCTRAESAWGRHQAGATAAELLMIADHFERAARDVRYTMPAAAVEDVARLRTMAALLSQTGMTKSSAVDIALSRIDKDVHELIDRVGAPSVTP